MLATPLVPLDGSPLFVLAEALRPDDLVVLTSLGRRLLGSVAEYLVRLAAGPALLVRARPNATERPDVAPACV